MTDKQKRVLAAIKLLELESSSGEVTPRALWEAARDPSHPLHGDFEWDDAKAADAHRDEQARQLLRLRVSMTYEDRVVAAPICVRVPEAAGAGYVRTAKVMGDREKSRQVMLDDVDRARCAIERATLVARALGIESECQALLDRLVSLRSRLAA